jgi:hypothetical protein
MSLAIILLLVSTAKLDAILAARSELSSVPFGTTPTVKAAENPRRGFFINALGTVQRTWGSLMLMLVEWLEFWTAPKDDTTIAWTLGIGWACCGGALAGGTLVFAKVSSGFLLYHVLSCKQTFDP